MISKEQNTNHYRFAIKPKWLSVSSATVIKVTGEDALSFLQGQFSQELRPDRAPVAAYGFWLTQKGRVMGDSVVVRSGGGVWRVFSWSVGAAKLLARFESYIIADDVELADETDRWSAWNLMGLGVEEWARTWSETAGDRAIAWAAGGDFPVDRMVLVAIGGLEWPAGWAEGDARDFEGARILAGDARVPVDLGPDDMPQEAGAEKRGVSFTKGCYLGQEVMARVRALGRVRRRLVRVRGIGPAPADGAADLWQEETRVGVLRSRVQVESDAWVGFAMMSLASWDETKPLVCAVVGGREMEIGLVGEEWK